MYTAVYVARYCLHAACPYAIVRYYFWYKRITTQILKIIHVPLLQTLSGQDDITHTHTVYETEPVLVMAVEVVWLSGGPLCPVVLVLCFFCTPSPSWPLTPDWSFLSADFSRLSSVLKSCCILCPDTFTRFLRACTSRACVECRVRASVCVCVCVCS